MSEDYYQKYGRTIIDDIHATSGEALAFLIGGNVLAELDLEIADLRFDYACKLASDSMRAMRYTAEPGGMVNEWVTKSKAFMQVEQFVTEEWQEPLVKLARLISMWRLGYFQKVKT